MPSSDMCVRSHGHRKAAHREVACTGLSSCGLRVLLLGLQRTANSPRLLGPQVKGLVLLALVLLSGILLLLLVVHGQHTGDGLPDGLDLRKLRSGATRNLRNAQLRQLALQLVQLLEKLLGGTAAELVRLDTDHGSGWNERLAAAQGGGALEPS